MLELLDGLKEVAATSPGDARLIVDDSLHMYIAIRHGLYNYREFQIVIYDSTRFGDVYYYTPPKDKCLARILNKVSSTAPTKYIMAYKLGILRAMKDS